MNTNTLKKFAQDTLKKLQEAINATSKEQVVDKVAYTWFNRFMALRFMDANDYQPIGISVVTPKTGFTLPELLDEAKRGTIPDELPVKAQRVYDLLDGKIPSTDAQNEAYKELLIAACNHLHKTFPFLFERINDYAELLLPNDLTSEFSIVQDIREGMTKEDCQEVEIIGWLYQFYISERKDEVFAAKRKVQKEDIPAATQLFTPRWIVEYMVQNTLGKLWLQNRPNSELRQHMPYFIESPSVESDDFLKVEDVKDISLLDQACGSGHILVYAFELFSKIYEEEGYNPSEIPQLIIEKNLHGFEIDERAAQLAGFALMMKARTYHRRVFRKELKPNILRYEDLKLNMFGQDDFENIVTLKTNSPVVKTYLEYGYRLAEDIVEKWQEVVTNKKTGEKKTINKSKTHIYKGNSTSPNNMDTIRAFSGNEITFYDDDIRNCFKTLNIPLSNQVYSDLVLIKQATNFGSLILPKSSLSELAHIQQLLFEKTNSSDVFLQNQIKQLTKSIHQLTQLARKYHCVVDNPPYMGSGKMNKILSSFTKKQYPDSKADLMSCFMEAGLKILYSKGFLGIINQHSWMFLSGYEAFRKKLIKETFFDTFLHLGAKTFPEIGGEVVQNSSFVFWNKKIDEEGKYIRLVDLKDSEAKREGLISAISDTTSGRYYAVNQIEFERIPGKVIGYWLTESMIKSFENKKLNEYAEPKQGLATGDNNQFLRYWQEVKIQKTPLLNIKLNWQNKHIKWFGCNKGGPYRKWYGNNYYIVDWGNDGKNIREDKLDKLAKGKIIKGNSRPWNSQYYFREGLTWSTISSYKPSFRYTPKGFVFETKGSMVFPANIENIYMQCGYLNSLLVETFLNAFSPTLDFHEGPVGKLPYKNFKSDFIEQIVQRNIALSKYEWDSREGSWDFQKNEMLIHKNQNFETTYQAYCQYWCTQHHQLHQNEEELNRQFIKIYGLEEELMPDVPLEDITILKQETSIENGELVFHADEVIRQFISYAVGCMFGRYSLDKEGLILANQGETLEDYLKKMNKAEADISFLPDDDNIIPILDADWFPDDITGRFNEFLKVTFGADQFEQNLSFLEECLGKDIRKYFVKDFYKDHIKRYKKRPIYWLFASPKGSFSVLIYLHRYTPDTLNEILNGYLKEYRTKLKNHISYLDHQIETGSSAEQTKAAKEKEKTQRILLELQEYEREILYPLATERIALDLDDGVLVNYNKFGKAIKLVSGLNDKKAKAKVRKFDWIEVGEIRD